MSRSRADNKCLQTLIGNIKGKTNTGDIVIAERLILKQL
jgi:hypothetical protein